LRAENFIKEGNPAATPGLAQELLVYLVYGSRKSPTGTRDTFPVGYFVFHHRKQDAPHKEEIHHIFTRLYKSVFKKVEALKDPLEWTMRQIRMEYEQFPAKSKDFKEVVVRSHSIRALVLNMNDRMPTTTLAFHKSQQPVSRLK
jgi:hypothetical protein